MMVLTTMGVVIVASDRSQALERSVLDLGTELYHLKSEVLSLRNAHHRLVCTIEALKGMLDDKGLVASDEFESIVDMAHEQAAEQALPAEAGKKSLN